MVCPRHNLDKPDGDKYRTHVHQESCADWLRLLAPLLYRRLRGKRSDESTSVKTIKWVFRVKHSTRLSKWAQTRLKKGTRSHLHGRECNPDAWVRRIANCWCLWDTLFSRAVRWAMCRVSRRAGPLWRPEPRRRLIRNVLDVLHMPHWCVDKRWSNTRGRQIRFRFFGLWNICENSLRLWWT